MKKQTNSFLGSVVVLHFQISLTFGKFPPRTFSQPQQQTTRVFRMKAFSIYILVNLINVVVLPKGISSIMHKRFPHTTTLPSLSMLQGKVSSVGLGQKSNLGLGHSFSVAFCSALHPQIWIV